MASEEIHKNDIGITFKVTLKDGTTVVDISSASVKNIILGKPDGTKLTKAGSFTTDGTDGILQYNTISGDLDIIGIWDIQAQITLPSGSWKSDIASFDVFGNI